MNIIDDININVYLDLPDGINDLTDESFVTLIYDVALKYYNFTSIDEFVAFTLRLQNISTVEADVKQVINKNGLIYSLIDFNSMSTGQWVDLDFYCKDFKYCKEFMSIIYRTNHLEAYTGSNASSMEDIGILEYRGAIKAYNEWKLGFVKSFPYLFPESDELDDEEDDDEIKFLTDEAQFAEEFGWYPILYMAANEQFLKIDEVTNKSASEFLYFVNFLKRKSVLDNNRIKHRTTNH